MRERRERLFLFFLLALAILFTHGCGDDAKSKGKISSNNTADMDAGANNTSTNNTSTNNTSPNSNPALCGNGSVDPGELCDSGIATGPGSCPNACPPMNDCQVGVVTGTAAQCSASCSYTEVTTCQGGEWMLPELLHERERFRLLGDVWQRNDRSGRDVRR